MSNFVRFLFRGELRTIRFHKFTHTIVCDWTPEKEGMLGVVSWSPMRAQEYLQLKAAWDDLKFQIHPELRRYVDLSPIPDRSVLIASNHFLKVPGKKNILKVSQKTRGEIRNNVFDETRSPNVI